MCCAVMDRRGVKVAPEPHGTLRHPASSHGDSRLVANAVMRCLASVKSNNVTKQYMHVEGEIS